MKFRLSVITLVALLAAWSPASADIITLDTAGVAGLNDLNSHNDSADAAQRLIWANTIIALPLNYVPSPVDDPDPATKGPVLYWSSTIKDYTSPFVEMPIVTGTNIVPDDAGYVLAKYDGPNAGYVLFYIPDLGSTAIPADAGFRYWDNDYDKDGNLVKIKEYGLSGYTVYTTVPDGGSMLTLLGMALIGLAGVRRMMK